MSLSDLRELVSDEELRMEHAAYFCAGSARAIVCSPLNGRSGGEG